MKLWIMRVLLLAAILYVYWTPYQWAETPDLLPQYLVRLLCTLFVAYLAGAGVFLVWGRKNG